MAFNTLDYEGQGRTVESSAEQCATRCLNTANCIGSTFYSDGGCHLSADGAELVEAGDVIAHECTSNIVI